MSFFNELKRRNVIKVAAAYVIVAWLLMQVSDTLVPALHLPEWFHSGVAFVLIIGFPIAMIFAWAFEMTPEGLKKEKEVDRNLSIASETGRKLDFIIIGVLAVTLGYFAIDKFVLDPGRDAEDIEAAVQTAQETTAVEEPEISHQSIAVLPFDNRSNLEEDEFFVEGIHDDLLTTIAKIGSLKVISRTSVMDYRDTTKKIPEIARELGVANILEGGIQRSGDTVRINVQLIDASTDEHLWAEIFDRKLTAENLFAIQSEISHAIARALQTALSPDEQERINTMPTQDLAAYDAYLRGRRLLTLRTSSSLQQAVVEFERAVFLDPEFALAWVGLADSHLLLITYTVISREEAYQVAEKSIRKALAINDEIGEAYASLADIYRYRMQMDEAEAAFRKALELSPNYAPAYHWYANFLGNYPLRTEERLHHIRKAFELDPQSPIIGVSLGAAYGMRGLYSLTERQYKKVIELNPDFSQVYTALSSLYSFNLGRFDEGVLAARRALELDPANIRNLAILSASYAQLGLSEQLRAVIDRMEDLSADHPWTAFVTAMSSLNSSNPAGTRESVAWALPRVEKTPRFRMTLAKVALVIGETGWAREIYLQAEPGWLLAERWEGLISQYPHEACLMSWLLLNTGDEGLGSSLLNQAAAYHEQDLPTVVEHADSYGSEICHLSAGQTSKALDALELQFEHGHIFGWKYFLDMPVYDPVRLEPRFQALRAALSQRLDEQRANLIAADAEAGS